MPDPEYDAFLNRSLHETLTRVLAGDHDRDEIERLLAALPTEEQFPDAEPPMRVLCWASNRSTACDRVRHHLGLHSWESEPAAVSANDVPPGELLTANEREAISLAGRLVTLCGTIVGDGPTRSEDINEIVGAVHVVQNALLAQAAARAYPDTYRLMGETVKGEPE